jgi:hypothetical protein
MEALCQSTKAERLERVVSFDSVATFAAGVAAPPDRELEQRLLRPPLVETTAQRDALTKP